LTFLTSDEFLELQLQKKRVFQQTANRELVESFVRYLEARAMSVSTVRHY